MAERKDNKFSRTRVRVAMVRQDISTKELARRLGRPRPSVSKAINNKKAFPLLKQEIMKEVGLCAS